MLPDVPKSWPATADPSDELQVTLAALVKGGVRVTCTLMAGPPSITEYAGCEKLNAEGSLSAMVTVAEAGVPAAAPVAPVSVTVNVRGPSGTESSRIGTAMTLSALSPSAQLSVPLTSV